MVSVLTEPLNIKFQKQVLFSAVSELCVFKLLIAHATDMFKHVSKKSVLN
jgi:hypothetical protein